MMIAKAQRLYFLFIGGQADGCWLDLTEVCQSQPSWEPPPVLTLTRPTAEEPNREADSYFLFNAGKTLVYVQSDYHSLSDVFRILVNNYRPNEDSENDIFR